MLLGETFVKFIALSKGFNKKGSSLWCPDLPIARCCFLGAISCNDSMEDGQPNCVRYANNVFIRKKFNQVRSYIAWLGGSRRARVDKNDPYVFVAVVHVWTITKLPRLMRKSNANAMQDAEYVTYSAQNGCTQSYIRCVYSKTKKTKNPYFI